MSQKQIGLQPRKAAKGTPEGYLSSARAAVYQRLRALDRWVTVGELADEFGQHRNTVRNHLDALVEAGFITAEASAPIGRGRPATLFRAKKQDLTEDTTYVALAVLMCKHIAASSDPANVAEELGSQWASVLQPEPTTGLPDEKDPLYLLQSLGFEPGLQEDGHTVVLGRCPANELAEAVPEVAWLIHAAMIKTLFAERGITNPYVIVAPAEATDKAAQVLLHPSADLARQHKFSTEAAR